MLKEHARFQLVQGLLVAAERQEIAGNNETARALVEQAIEIDPKFDVARERLAELTPDSPRADSPEQNRTRTKRLVWPACHDLIPNREHTTSTFEGRRVPPTRRSAGNSV